MRGIFGRALVVCFLVIGSMASVPAAEVEEAQPAPFNPHLRLSGNLFFARRDAENPKNELKTQSVFGAFLEADFHPLEKFSANLLIGQGFLTNYKSQRESFFLAAEGQFLPISFFFGKEKSQQIEMGILLGINNLQKSEELPFSSHFGAKVFYFFQPHHGIQTAVRANLDFWMTSLGYVWMP